MSEACDTKHCLCMCVCVCVCVCACVCVVQNRWKGEGEGGGQRMVSLPCVTYLLILECAAPREGDECGLEGEVHILDAAQQVGHPLHVCSSASVLPCRKDE